MHVPCINRDSPTQHIPPKGLNINKPFPGKVRLLMTIIRPVGLLMQGNNPGKNDGQMAMGYHGLPWTTMVFHGHTSMVYHGLTWYSMVIQPWSTMVDHVL